MMRCSVFNSATRRSLRRLLLPLSLLLLVLRLRSSSAWTSSSAHGDTKRGRAASSSSRRLQPAAAEPSGWLDVLKWEGRAPDFDVLAKVQHYTNEPGYKSFNCTFLVVFLICYFAVVTNRTSKNKNGIRVGWQSTANDWHQKTKIKDSSIFEDRQFLLLIFSLLLSCHSLSFFFFFSDGKT